MNSARKTFIYVPEVAYSPEGLDDVSKTLLSWHSSNWNDWSYFQNDSDVEELHSLNPIKTSSVINNVHAPPSKSAEPKSDETNPKRSPDSAPTDMFTSRDTPRDMAEYIFWTGDDNGVSSAIKDFVLQGLVSFQCL